MQPRTGAGWDSRLVAAASRGQCVRGVTVEQKDTTLSNTPDISKTIADGYSQGLDRIGAWGPAVAVVAAVAGVASGGISQLQIALIPDASEILQAAFSGDANVLSGSEMRTFQLLSAASMVISFVLSIGALALFSGLLHRERAGEAVEAPSPAEVIPALFSQFMLLMPRVAMLVGLLVLGQLLSAFSAVLGGIVSFAGLIVMIWLGVRWTYATVISGSGEATGDAAFDRSADVVDGSWWPTFGVFFVVSLATMLPVGILASIVGAILPGAFLSSFGSSFISMIGYATIAAAALESAWAQVSSGAGGPGAGRANADAAGTNELPGATRPDAPGEGGTSAGPFV